MMIVALITSLASKTNAMIDMFILETSSLLQNMIFSNYCKWDDTFLPVTSSWKEREILQLGWYVERRLPKSLQRLVKNGKYFNRHPASKTLLEEWVLVQFFEVREAKLVNESQRRVIYKLSIWRMNVWKFVTFYV